MWLTIPKAWQDHDVNFRVTEEPEQMLEHDRIAATCCREERCGEVSVRQEHGQRAWQAQEVPAAAKLQLQASTRQTVAFCASSCRGHACSELSR